MMISTNMRGHHVSSVQASFPPLKHTQSAVSNVTRPSKGLCLGGSVLANMVQSFCNVLPPHKPGKRLVHVAADISGVSQEKTSKSSSGIVDFKDAEMVPVRNADGVVGSFPDAPGVYGFYNTVGELQYIGLSRKVSQTVVGYAKALPELTQSVKFTVSQAASREQLIEVWKSWMQEAFAEMGKIPPGNDKNDQTWTPKKKVKSEIKLTPGKGLQDLTCSISDLVDQVVKSFKVVAFVKGTRTQPQCGFSYKVLSMLNELGADYEVVNVLDEQYNPTLREVIKQYSEWPTIPQLYVKGEFVGGADILEEMHNKGELKELLQS